MIKMRSKIMYAVAVMTMIGGLNALVAESQTTNAEIEKQIRSIERDRFVAMQQRDLAALSRTLADGLVFIDTKGRLLNKAQYMDEIKSGDLKFLTVDNHDEEFYLYENTAIMSGVASSKVEYRGKVNMIPRRFTSVFVKTNGQWLLVAHQATLIAGDK